VIAGLPLTVVDRTYTEDGTVLRVEGPEAVLNDPVLGEWVRR
jgi:lactam utilization protein B